MKISNFLHLVMHKFSAHAELHKRRLFGLSLAQLEEFAAYIIMVLLGIKDAYLCGYLFATDHCSCTSATTNIRSVLVIIQTTLKPFFASVKLICICLVQSEEPDMSFFNASRDYIFLRQDFYYRKLSQLPCNNSRTEHVFLTSHPLVVDVSGTQLVRLSADTIKALLTRMCTCFGDNVHGNSTNDLEFIKPMNVSQLCSQVSLCLTAGWLLGYPCLYRNIQQCCEEPCDSYALGTNALSLQLLRQFRVSIPTRAFLEFELGSSFPSEISEGSKVLSFGLDRDCSVFEFTVPVALLSAGTELNAFECALEQQVKQVQKLFPTAVLSQQDFSEPTIMM